jgi:chromosome segregation ATPase
MDIGDKIKSVIQKVIQDGIKELIIPELETIKAENREIKATLQLTNKRLDDINIHIVDQSRRIDETNKRIDETNKRIDELDKSLTMRIDELDKKLTMRIDETNKRIDKLYEVIVRREEHEKLEIKVMQLEQDIADVKKQIQKRVA